MTEQKIDGVSATNIRGEIILFVDTGWKEFSAFKIDGNQIALEAPNGEIHSKTYGPLTVETARRSGRILVVEIQNDGKAGRSLVVEAARGR